MDSMMVDQYYRMRERSFEGYMDGQVPEQANLPNPAPTDVQEAPALTLLDSIFTQEQNTCAEIKNTAEAIVKISREALSSGCGRDFTSHMKTQTEYLVQMLSMLDGLERKKRVFGDEFIDCATKDWIDNRVAHASRQRKIRGQKRKEYVERAKNALLEVPVVDTVKVQIEEPDENKDCKVRSCHFCGITHSPEWRRGPTGSTNLCNACGLFYAKSIKDQLPARPKKSKIQHTSQFKAAKVPRTRAASTSSNMQASQRMALCNLYTSSIKSKDQLKNEKEEAPAEEKVKVPPSNHSHHQSNTFTRQSNPSQLSVSGDDVPMAFCTSPIPTPNTNSPFAVIPLSPFPSYGYTTPPSTPSSTSTPSSPHSSPVVPFTPPRANGFVSRPQSPRLTIHTDNTPTLKTSPPPQRHATAKLKSNIHALCTPSTDSIPSIPTSTSPQAKAMNLNWLLN